MPQTSDPSPRTLTGMALGLLLLGLLWRTVRYVLQFPIWGDEAMLAMNFVWFDYAALTQRLENCQVAPLLFLWGERTALCWLGSGELSMRLLPYLAGLGSLGLYWRLTGLILSPRARLFAVGFLAVASFPVSMSALLKPYSFDLLMSLLLLVPAVQWFQAPERTRWLAFLTLLTPVALLGSYPAVFVAGGISLALLPRAWQEGWSTRCWWAAYNVAVVAGFGLVCYIGTNQLNTPAGGESTQTGMTSYWAHGFPPASPLAFVWWFFLLTAGQMSAYPIGAAHGGSILTVLFCLAGAAWCVRKKQWPWLVLFSAPLLLNLVAAALHRYPYGAAGRLSQHLAPGICIFAGLGLAALIDRTSRLAARRAAGTLAFVGLFALVGLAGLTLDIVRPYHDPGCAWMRRTMSEMRRQVPVTDPVVVCGEPRGVEAVFVWYWLNEGGRVSWNYELPPATPEGGQLWGFHNGPGGDGACQRLGRELRRCDPAWRLVKRVPYTHQPQDAKDAPQQCELFCFARSGSRAAGAQRH
jgi:Dolichyl-phosphate-mannose-protein mannosyltransferase